MLSVRRCVSGVAATALAVLTVAVPVPPAQADPGDPGGCSLPLCDLPGGPPVLPGDPGGDIGDPLSGGCQAVTDPVQPGDTVGLTQPGGIPGKWAYQICGQPDSVTRAVTSGQPISTIKTWCLAHFCSVVVFWLPDHPDPLKQVPVGRPDHGFFSITADAHSSPPNGNVIAQFPTWFWDENRTSITGGAVPVPDFGAGAIAIHIGSDWTVDGAPLCSDQGSIPTFGETRPSPDCGVTFHTLFAAGGRQHSVELAKTWLIIIFLAFPPYVIVFPITFHDTININVHEAQADTQ